MILGMEIIILIILTLLNGFFALSEISIISVKKSRVEQKARQGSKNARILLGLMQEPAGFLSAVQVGITLIGIISGAYGGAALSDDVRALLLGLPWLAPYADTLAIVLVIGTITYFSIVIGELIPKTLAIGNAEGIALFVAPSIKVFTTLTLPLVKILSASTGAVVRLLGIRQSREETISEEELRQIIKTAGVQGVLAKEETELHQNIFHYTEQKARNIFTHRREVEWINSRDSLEEIKAKIHESAHSKFPVGDGQFDNIVGILTAKDFYEHVLAGKQSLQEIIQPPLYVSETMYAHAILNLFKKHKQYLAIVVDEFGSTEGILTLHDILEVIVGDLPDLDESDEPAIIRREDNSYLVNGDISIYDLNRELSREFIARDSESFSTLAGFIMHNLHHLPVTGEKIQHNGFQIEVVDMDGIKIDKVLIRKVASPVLGS
jgi:putative hemolysin